MKRALVIGGGVLGLIVIVLAVVIYMTLQNIDSIVKTAIEKVGSDVSGTEVSLNNVELSLTEGRGSLLGFKMTNPEGFKSDEAFQFDEVTVKLDLATIASDPVIIKEVLIRNPVVTYEIGDKETNLDRIQKNVESSSPSSAGSGSSDGGKAPKIIIETLVMTGGKVNVVASQFMDNSMSAGLPDIRLTDIGKEDNGATPGAIAQELMDEMLTSVSAAVSNIDISKITSQLGESVKGIVESVDTKAIEGGASDALGGAAEGAGEALKGLLGGDNN